MSPWSESRCQDGNNARVLRRGTRAAMNNVSHGMRMFVFCMKFIKSVTRGRGLLAVNSLTGDWAARPSVRPSHNLLSISHLEGLVPIPAQFEALRKLQL